MISQQLSHTVSIPVEELASLCRKYHIKELSIFGSSIHGDAEPESDLDVLVELFPGHTPSSLSRYFRDTVLREAQVAYAAN